MFQLVLQFDCESLQAIDDIVELEDELIMLIGESADVDGHDIGSDEANIFIHTLQPVETFKKCHALLKSKGQKIANFRAAYRSLAGSPYTMLYPDDLAKFRVA